MLRLGTVGISNLRAGEDAKNHAMSVTYLLPDAIFQFIGAHTSATAQIGRDTAGAAERAAVGAAATVGQGMRMTGHHVVRNQKQKTADTTKDSGGEGGVTGFKST